MELEKFIRDLKKDWVKVVEESQRIQYIEISGAFTFWNQNRRTSPYTTLYGDELAEKLDKIIRIEIRQEGEYYPVWTREDGIIDLNEKFVRLNGRYYTIPFLENLINKIDEFKRLNI
ncbi:hypothetical protein [Sphingobacterium sp. HMA12]|uniref:hypothetical protein n=1 Tax=Sphingobacterium sp. HMA12 TaxID=2050894 RepID=UPI000CE9D586|nr:hypothetical protein [Sphingobacterium sp. HMA12]